MQTYTHKNNKNSHVRTSLFKKQDGMAQAKEERNRGEKPDFGFHLNEIDFSVPADSATNHPIIQPKLKIGTPNDKYEQEADRMAEQVMRMTDSQQQTIQPAGANLTDQLQMKCTECEEEEMMQLKPIDKQNIPEIQRQEEEEEEELQMKADTSNQPTFNPSQSTGLVPTKGGGSPLPDNERDFFETRFGHDFSKVRIHHDSESAKTARSIHAKAFTLGSNIVFGQGHFTPGNSTGRTLLAHELTHVIQQGKAPKLNGIDFHSRLSPARPMVQKKGGPKKPAATNIKNALKAQKMVWDDLRAFFPDDIGKVAGTGYRESAGFLQTDFTEKTEGPSTSSAPIIYVGNSYFTEKDADKRKEKLQEEVKKINTWRINTGRVENDDLKSADLKAQLQDLSADKKLKMIGKLKERKGATNNEVIEFLNKVMQSTPIVEGATARDQGGFEVQFDNVKIIVLPDVYNSSGVSSGGAETRIKSVPDSPTWYNTPGFNWDGSGRITSMTFTPSRPDIVYTVQTHYGSGATPRDTSGYGVGTRPGDTTSEQKTLGHHEGAHGEEFIKSIKAGTSGTKWPEYTGKIGDNRRPFETAHNAWRRDITKFKQMIDKALEDNIQTVDCTGKTIERYHQEKGTSTTVHCH